MPRPRPYRAGFAALHAASSGALFYFTQAILGTVFAGFSGAPEDFLQERFWGSERLLAVLSFTFVLFIVGALRRPTGFPAIPIASGAAAYILSSTALSYAVYHDVLDVMSRDVVSATRL